MKTLKEKLESCEYEIERYIEGSGWSNITANKGDVRVHIDKTYKGYELEAQEWINDNFGKRYEIKSTKIKDIMHFLKHYRFI